MAQETLELTTDTSSIPIRIDGVLYQLKHPDSLPFSVQHRIARLGRMLTDLSKIPDESDDWYEARYERVDRLMVEAMGALFVDFTDEASAAVEQLGVGQRMEIVNAVFTKAAPKESPKKTKRKASSRASKDSTEDSPPTG